MLLVEVICDVTNIVAYFSYMYALMYFGVSNRRYHIL